MLCTTPPFIYLSTWPQQVLLPQPTYLPLVVADLHAQGSKASCSMLLKIHEPDIHDEKEVLRQWAGGWRENSKHLMLQVHIGYHDEASHTGLRKVLLCALSSTNTQEVVYHVSARGDRY